jgi:hypothetical protein
MENASDSSAAPAGMTLSPAPPTIAELIEVVIDSFALMGASPAQLMANRLRLQREPAYFEEWVVRIHEWHSSPIEHLQRMRDDGYMDFLLGPDFEIE